MILNLWPGADIDQIRSTNPTMKVRLVGTTKLELRHTGGPRPRAGRKPVPVECCGCPATDPRSSNARSLGWKQDKNHPGTWLCPDCQRSLAGVP